MPSIFWAILLLLFVVLAFYLGSHLLRPSSPPTCQPQSNYLRVLAGDWVLDRMVSLKSNSEIPVDKAAVPSFRIQPDPQYQGNLKVFKGVNKAGYAPFMVVPVQCDGTIPEVTTDGVYKVKITPQTETRLLFTDNTDGGRQLYLSRV